MKLNFCLLICICVCLKLADSHRTKRANGDVIAPAGDPGTPPPNNQKPTPEPRGDVDNSLYTLLLKIDKAIQDNDMREYFRDLSDHESVTPLEQRCQTFNAPTTAATLQMFDNSDSSSPVIALFNNPSRLTVSRSPEFTFISSNDCNLEGVRIAQQDLRIAVRRYHRAFLDLTYLRESYAENNDLFANQLTTLRQNPSEADGRLGKVQLIYFHIKKAIEAGISQFLTQVSELAGEIARLQRIAIGRRMGWGYLLNYPSANFVVVVRHPSLLYTLATRQNLIRIPDNWIPSNYRTTPRPEFIKKRSLPETEISPLTNNSFFNNYLSPVHSNCIVNVTSLRQFSELMSFGRNETFEIFALQEEDEMTLLKIDHLHQLFNMWDRTTSNWFTSWYWRQKYMYLRAKFENLMFYLKNPHYNQINKKLKIIQYLNCKLTEETMNSKLDWYYLPNYIYEEIDKALTSQIEIAKTAITVYGSVKVDKN